MNPAADLETIHRQATLSSLAGFAFLSVFAGVWTAAGILSYLLPADLAPWAYVCLGIVGMPIAMLLERRVGFVPAPNPDPLLPLTLQILFVQVVAFSAILLVWESSAEFLPVAFAAIVGAHFLPFHWVYQTRIYSVMGVAIATGPFLLAVLFDEQALHYTGFFVGAVLLAGALGVRTHARRVRQQSGQHALQPVHH